MDQNQITFGEVSVKDPELCAALRAAFQGNASNAQAALALRLKANKLSRPSLRERVLILFGLEAGAAMAEARQSMRITLRFFGRYLRMNPVAVHGL